MKIKKFSQSIFTTRPILPPVKEFNVKIQKIWQSRMLANMGSQHRELEKKITRLLKVPYCSLFNNGTVALMIAIKSLELKGEVITTPFTFPASLTSLTWNNISPVFCDTDPNTLTIDANKIESLITNKTTGILGVHVYGNPCDVKKIDKIAKKHKLKIIYDAAHAFGAEINNVGIGNFGDITMFSFHATKLFHTAEGGALTYKDKNLGQKLYLLKNFGIRNEEEVVLPGINGKMNEIQAALGLTVLKLFEKERKKRGKIRKIYNHFLNKTTGISLIDYPSNLVNSNQYFIIRINTKKFGISRDEVYERFKKYNLFARKYFYPLCSSYPFYKNLPSASRNNLPNAYKASSEVLALPFYGELTDHEIEKICLILLSFRK